MQGKYTIITSQINLRRKRDPTIIMSHNNGKVIKLGEIICTLMQHRAYNRRTKKNSEIGALRI